MTPERAKELLPIIQAFSEGKTIQIKDAGTTTWRDLKGYAAFDAAPSVYRIKPEVVRYRRYILRNGEEYMVIAADSNSNYSPKELEKNSRFVRWIDTDWVEEEV